ncbi:MAG: patatin-like phospholipase family protein [Alphaproteobacteria bacterium]|nr:patatin-like phospholipase family protein [Alphaproteobacteria bacterium]
MTQTIKGSSPKTVAGKPSRRSAKHEKAINIALQGGGAHGAYTWGVLDKLFEDDRIWIEAISGTSAGAMNAVVAAMGMRENGAVGARERLHEFWRAVSQVGIASPIQRSIWAKMHGNWSLSGSPSYILFDLMSRLASPYDLNPFDHNPLRDLVAEFVDFDKVAKCQDMEIFLSATNVETGLVRVFRREEVHLDTVMASACLPFMFKAVKIDDVAYWDGGYMGNPPLFPFIGASPSDDIVIVQINPVRREKIPTTAAEIQNRVNEITFNSALLHELRTIDFVTRLLDAGKLEPDEYRRMNVHIVNARKQMRELDASSKLNAEWHFLQHLFEIGRGSAQRWLDENYDSLGKESSVDIREMFTGVAGLHP